MKLKSGAERLNQMLELGVEVTFGCRYSPQSESGRGELLSTYLDGSREYVNRRATQSALSGMDNYKTMLDILKAENTYLPDGEPESIVMELHTLELPDKTVHEFFLPCKTYL